VAKLLLFLAVLYSIALLGLSLGNISDLPQLDITNADKLYHATAYFGLVLLWFLYFFMRKANDRFRLKSLLFVCVCALFFGIFIELLQRTLTTNRSWDYFDMLANLCGIALAFLVLFPLRKKLEKLK
jgi:VanZ family protein